MSAAQPVPYRLSPGDLVTVRPRDADPTVFCVVGNLGDGANNATYLARGPASVLVALKSTRWEHASDAPLQIEEKILLQLDHENMVSFFGSGNDTCDRKILAYERGFPNPLLVLSKPSVRKFFPTDEETFYRALPPRVALQQSVELLRAIEHLQQQGFVHHDIKPSNMLARVQTDAPVLSDSEFLEKALNGESQLMLIDIGGSRSKAYLRALNAGGSDQDMSIVPPQLTPLYAPPEALLPNPTPAGPRPLLHPSLDLYAAAMVVYANVTGRLPYDHLSLDISALESLRVIKRREREDGLIPISRKAILAARGYGGCNEDLYTFMCACLDPDPAIRPTPGDAREYLERICAQASTATSAPAIFFGSELKARGEAKPQEGLGEPDR